LVQPPLNTQVDATEKLISRRHLELLDMKAVLANIHIDPGQEGIDDVQAFRVRLFLNFTEENGDAYVAGGHGMKKALPEHEYEQCNDRDGCEFRIHETPLCGLWAGTLTHPRGIGAVASTRIEDRSGRNRALRSRSP
jgi:hypothetical protein